MGYQLPTQKRINPRTARPAHAAGAPYLVLLRAHYISGFGLAQPGAVVTLGEGVKPGKYLLALSSEDATECLRDPAFAARLADEAGAKLQAEINEARKLRSDDLKIEPEPAKAEAPKSDKGK